MTEKTLIDLRDAIFDRIKNPAVYKIQRKTPMPTLQSTQLPALGIFILGGQGQPDGDANVGNIRLINDDTLAISIVRGMEDPVALEGAMDGELEAFKVKLFTDRTFVTFGDGYFFEALLSTRRRWLFPPAGDQYLIELRYEMTFRKREGFDPIIPDDYEKTVLTTRPLGHDDKTPAITTVIDSAV